MSVFALILAGGLGTRLWPLTANNTPKAFLSFDNSNLSLLQRTIIRVEKVTSKEKIYISAGKNHKESLYQQAQNLPENNIILEPLPKGTLACIGLSSLYIKKQDSSAIIISMPGEQLIKNDKLFQKIMVLAVESAQKYNTIITLGIKPSFPATRFGYIHIGKKIFYGNDVEAFESLGFTEKPDEKKALEFFNSGVYLWNSGIYIFPVSLLFELIHDLVPNVYNILSEIEGYIGTPNELEVIERLYPKMPNISIDYAIMEKYKNMLVIPADMDWNDMGTWVEVAETWNSDSNNNSYLGEYINLDSDECIVYSPNIPVTTIGIQGLIIINTPNGLLVCPKDRIDDIKALIQKQ
jgi:mannose-1-phosphate guanylyltransferase